MVLTVRTASAGPSGVSHADGILEDMSARMRSPVLVGRAEHLSTLDASLDRSRAGGPSTVFIDGEVGIGKSRLVDEFAAGAAEAGPAVLIIEDAHWADRSTRHLMAFLIGKLDHFVFYRRTITRSYSLNSARIQRRLIEVLANSVVQGAVCVTNIALQLWLLDPVRRKRKGYGSIVRLLRLECGPVNRPTIETWRRSRF